MHTIHKKTTVRRNAVQDVWKSDFFVGAPSSPYLLISSPPPPPNMKYLPMAPITVFYCQFPTPIATPRTVASSWSYLSSKFPKFSYSVATTMVTLSQWFVLPREECYPSEQSFLCWPGKMFFWPKTNETNVLPVYQLYWQSFPIRSTVVSFIKNARRCAKFKLVRSIR